MNYAFLSKTMLFKGHSEEEIPKALRCLGAYKKSFRKGETIYHAGQSVEALGLVMSGSVKLVANFYWGSNHIFAHLEPGQTFAESYTMLPGQELPIDVVAAEHAEVLFLNTAKIFRNCSHICPFRSQVIRNLLQISAQKNLMLSQRMMHTAHKSIRTRLLSYLSEQAIKNGTGDFDIVFSRQELADYLGVDRSALSNELSKMQKEGLLSYHRNHFSLKS